MEAMDVSSTPSLAEVVSFSARFFGKRLAFTDVEDAFFRDTVALEADKLLATRERVKTMVAATAIRRILMNLWGGYVDFGMI